MEELPVPDVRLFADRVLVRRFSVDSINIAADPVFRNPDGSNRVAHAQGEETSTGLLISSPGIRKDRAFVQSTGPNCQRLSVGDMVLLPPPDDKLQRFPLARFEKDGTEYLWFHENDLLARVGTVDVPVELLGAFSTPLMD